MAHFQPYLNLAGIYTHPGAGREKKPCHAHAIFLLDIPI